MDIERRADIIHNVDAQECGGCGCAIPEDAATNPEWFVDSEADADGTELATIRCPRCW